MHRHVGCNAVTQSQFNLGEDSTADTLSYANGGGKEWLRSTISMGQDALKVSTGLSATSAGVVTAAQIIGGALGASISSSDLTAGSATATFAYNGDLFFLGNQSAGATALDGTFADGEVVFQFVGITDIEEATLPISKASKLVEGKIKIYFFV